MSKTKMPATSIEAFRSLKECDIKKDYEGILKALSIIKEGTFEDISKSMKCKPERVWKRLSELHRKYMLIYRPGDRKTLKSGRSGFTWRLTDLGVEATKSIESFLPGKTVSDYSKDIQEIRKPLYSPQTLF